MYYTIYDANLLYCKILNAFPNKAQGETLSKFGIYTCSVFLSYGQLDIALRRDGQTVVKLKFLKRGRLEKHLNLKRMLSLQLCLIKPLIEWRKYRKTYFFKWKIIYK